MSWYGSHPKRTCKGRPMATCKRCRYIVSLFPFAKEWTRDKDTPCPRCGLTWEQVYKAFEE